MLEITFGGKTRTITIKHNREKKKKKILHQFWSVKTTRKDCD